MNRRAWFFFLILGSSVGHASVLSEWAAGLSAGSFVKLPANASLAALSLQENLFYYADTAVWNPVDKKVQFVGTPGDCCWDSQYRLLTYEESSDLWRVEDKPSFGRYGHAYDGNALNPSTGRHYFTLYNNPYVKAWDGNSWQELPPVPGSVESAMSLSWFPEAVGGGGALVHVNGSGKASWWQEGGTSWTALAPPSPRWGEYHVFSQHNPVHHLVWLGGGNGGGRVTYKLSAGMNLTPLATAPLDLGINSTLVSCDPVSGKFIVTNTENGDWWEYDITKDGQPGAWVLLDPARTPPLNHEDATYFQVPLPEHGVILYMDRGRDVYLYKHAVGTGPIIVAPARPRRLRVR